LQSEAPCENIIADLKKSRKAGLMDFTGSGRSGFLESFETRKKAMARKRRKTIAGANASLALHDSGLLDSREIEGLSARHRAATLAPPLSGAGGSRRPMSKGQASAQYDLREYQT